MSDLLVTPPVGPTSPPAEIRKWVKELERRISGTSDPAVEATYRSHLEDAELWLMSVEELRNRLA